MLDLININPELVPKNLPEVLRDVEWNNRKYKKDAMSNDAKIKDAWITNSILPLLQEF